METTNAIFQWPFSILMATALLATAEAALQAGCSQKTSLERPRLRPRCGSWWSPTGHRDTHRPGAAPGLAACSSGCGWFPAKGGGWTLGCWKVGLDAFWGLGAFPAQARLEFWDSLVSKHNHLPLPTASHVPWRVVIQPLFPGALCTLHTSLTVINAFHSLIPQNWPTPKARCISLNKSSPININAPWPRRTARLDLVAADWNG